MSKSFETNQQIITKDHGEIVLYQRSDHNTPRWQTRIKIKGSRSYVRKSTGMLDYVEALHYSTELYESLADKFRTTGSTNIRTFEQVVDEWLALQKADNSRTPELISEFRRRLKNYPVKFWGDTAIDTLQKSDLIDFIEWRKSAGTKKKHPSAATIKRDIVPLRQVFKYAYGKQYTSKSLQFDAVRVKSKRRPAFSQEEWENILEKLPTWVEQVAGHHRHRRDRFYLKHFIIFVGYSGVRPGTELYSLKWSNLKFQDLGQHKSRLVINVNDGKTGARTTIPDDQSLKHLEELQLFRITELESKKIAFSAEEAIFCHEDGQAIHSFKKGFNAFLEAYGLLKDSNGQRRVPYSLRHTYATRMINAGTNHWDLAKNMGTSVDQLEKYYVHDNPTLYGSRIADFPNQSPFKLAPSLLGKTP